MHVSIMEDDLFIAEQMAIYFEAKGAKVERFKDGDELLKSENLSSFDIFLLDVDTPHVNGWEALSYIRDIGIKTPAIFVTAKSHIGDVKQGYACGCSDYVRKPFDIEELELRMQALLPLETRNIFFSDTLSYDMDTHLLDCDGENIPLGQTEQRLLELLVRNQGQVVTVEDMREWVWQGKDVSEATIRSFMRMVREKVGAECITNHRGVGYQLILNRS